jgi:hypothetical protein
VNQISERTQPIIIISDSAILPPLLKCHTLKADKILHGISIIPPLRMSFWFIMAVDSFKCHEKNKGHGAKYQSFNDATMGYTPNNTRKNTIEYIPQKS